MPNTTRRELITGGICAALLPKIGGASPVKSMLGADAGCYIVGTETPSASEYVQDGLLLHYDGIENSGYGRHNPNATIWSDLIGNMDLMSHGGTSFIDGKASVIQGNAATIGWWGEKLEIGSGLCIEAVLDPSHGRYIVGCPFSSGVRPYINYNLIVWAAGVAYTSNPCTENNRSITVNFGNGVYLDGQFAKTIGGPVAGTSARPFGIGTYYTSATVNQKVFAVRVYDRQLTPDEIAYNHQLDCERFGL